MWVWRISYIDGAHDGYDLKSIQHVTAISAWDALMAFQQTRVGTKTIIEVERLQEVFVRS